MNIGGNLVIGNLQQTTTYLIDTGVGDAYAVSFLPQITGYTNGLQVTFLAGSSNTGLCTLEVDGYGPIEITKNVNESLSDGDILAGQIVTVVFDGTNFQLIATPQHPPISPFSTFLIDGGEITWLNNYNYTVSAANYIILGNQYATLQTDITLAPADPTFDRFDLVVVDTNDTVQVITGIPAEPTQLPSYDPATQLPLAFINVPAATTQPPCSLLTVVYREALGTPTEWTVVSSSGSIVVNSINNPRTGSKDIEGTAAVSGSTITFTPSSPFDSSIMTQLDLYIKSKGSWGTTGNGHRLSIAIFAASGQVGTPVIIPPRGSFGFNSNSSGNYQQIVIPKDLFSLPANTLITSIVFTIAGIDGTMGFYMDDISIETGCNIPASPTPLTFNSGLTQSGSVVQLGGTLLHNTTNNTGYFTHTLSGATVYNYPYQFSQLQDFANSTSIASFLSKGGVDPSSADLANAVRLGINYTSDIYSSPLYPGYMNDKIGYWLGVNARGNGSFGIYTDDPNSKTGGIFLHTLDSTYTDMITIFGKQPPTANSAISIQPGQTGFEPYRLLTLHTDGAATLWKYGTGSFSDSPAYALGVTGSGNVIEFAPAIGDSLRFGVSGEDDTAGENRDFNISTFDLSIGNTFTLAQVLSSVNAVYLQAQPLDGLSSASFDLEGNTGSNVGFNIQGSDSTSGFGTSLVGDAVLGNLTLYASNGITLNSYGSGSYTGTPTFGLAVDSAGKIIEVGTSSSFRFGVSGEDDTQTQARSFNTNGNTFNYTDGASTPTGIPMVQLVSTSTASGTVMSINAGGAFGGSMIGLDIGAWNGTAFQTNSLNGTGANIYSFNGTAAFIQSTSGVALDVVSVNASPVGKFTTKKVGTTAVEPILQLTRFGSSGVAPTGAGIGQSIEFYIETDTGSLPGTTQIANSLISKWTDATDATRTSQFSITGVNSATTQTLVKIDGNGTATFLGPSSPTNTIKSINTTGTGIKIETTSGTGLWAVASTSGIGGQFNSTSGVSIAGIINPSSTNSVSSVAQLERHSSGTAANGIGGSFDLYLQADNGSVSPANQIIWKYTDATSATRTSQFKVTGVLSASTVDVFTANADGSWQIRPITATAASAITPAEGMMLFVSNTDATFTSIGFWGYQNGAWHAF